MTLAQLVADAFPEGWAEKGTSPEQALANALDGFDARARRRLAREAAEVGRRGLCDMQLDALIAYELDGHLRPAEMGLTPSEWLTWLSDRIEPGTSGALGGRPPVAPTARSGAGA